MPNIKVKEQNNKTIKTLDKTANMAFHMKESILKAKQGTQEQYSDTNENVTEYASSEITNMASNIVNKTTNKTMNYLNKKARQGYEETKNNIKNAKQKIYTYKKQLTERRITKEPIKSTNQITKTNNNNIEKQTTGLIKNTTKTIKTPAITGKRAIKTTERVGKKIDKSAKKAKVSRRAARMSRESAKRAKQTIKMTFKAVQKTIKAIIKIATALMNLMLAGFWIIMMITIIICMIGLLVGSVYGIFFSGEYDSTITVDGTEQIVTISQLIQQLNQEYIDKINQIQNDVEHKEYDITTNRANWVDILAVYTVKVNGGENQNEVVTLNEEKINMLKEIFWTMNNISYTTDEKSHEQLQIGWTSTDIVTVTETTLHITIESKTVDEMADLYNFTEEQRKQLAELTDEKYASMWASVIGNTSVGNTDIIDVAIRQLGNQGGELYWKWYGFKSRVEWCAIWVSWCANECGYIDAGIIPKFANCQNEGIPWFKTCGLWQDRGYTPKAGDIIFFDWINKETGVRDGLANHVGIVEYVENGRVYTIEGNTSDRCDRRNYDLNSADILGYGLPRYPEQN